MYSYDILSLKSSLNAKCFRRRCTENQNTHFMLSAFFSENRAVYELIWKSTVQPHRPQMTK